MRARPRGGSTRGSLLAPPPPQNEVPMPRIKPARRTVRAAAACLLAGVLLLALISASDAKSAGRAASSPKPTIVLIHGAWADGSSWAGVTARLQKAGYTVDVPPNPLRGLASDSAYVASYLKS